MTAAPALPIVKVGDVVAYVDHHDRPQSGKVHRIEASWDHSPWPFILYCVEHPTYRNRRHYTDRVEAVNDND